MNPMIFYSLFFLLTGAVSVRGASVHTPLDWGILQGEGDEDPPSIETCVQSWTEARYLGLGYNHLVHLKNNCPLAVKCKVTTNVNPKPTVAKVPVKGQVEVVTFKGSPARTFTHQATCQWDE